MRHWLPILRVTWLAGSCSSQLSIWVQQGGSFSIENAARLVANDNAVISWTAAEGAKAYEVVVDEDGQCEGDGSIRFTAVRDTQLKLDKLAEGTYTICVYTPDLTNSRNHGAFSSRNRQKSPKSSVSTLDLWPQLG